jgi:hypothetical protein
VISFCPIASACLYFSGKWRRIQESGFIFSSVKVIIISSIEVVVIKDAIVSIFGNHSLTKKLNEVENKAAQIITVDDFLKMN